jgi:hypothetical protein
MLEPVETEFGTRRQFDFTGVPTKYVTAIQRRIRQRFYACIDCGDYLRAKNIEGLEKRVEMLFGRLRERLSEVDRYAEANLRSSTRFWQEIYWLGNTLDFGQVVPLSKAVSGALRLVFELMMNASANASHPEFANGTEFFVYPIRSALYIEDFRSRFRGRRHASKAMQYLIAAADYHETPLCGAVEAHDVDDIKPNLSDEDLFAWYGKLGFERVSSHPRMIMRSPEPSLSLIQRTANLTQARGALLADVLP